MGNILQPTRDITQSTQQFTCEICIEPASTTQKFNNRNLCSHPFCLDCVSKYIEVKILEHTPKIVCPGLNCEHNLDAVSCESLISKPLFAKWCDLLCEDYVLGTEKCYCPNRKCLEIVLNECSRGIVKKSKCPSCKELFCFQCKKGWHDGFRCGMSEAMNRNRNETLFGTLMERKKWKTCPACGHCIERTRGCHIVQCRIICLNFVRASGEEIELVFYNT
ncbi:E3 ubiquitin-protein ligase RSL1-like [Rutidosis leptorrhynchoides]|uniref:E3 ubiquitin-protein ligase RSL1-like n=1 Tax=Rutidosis leptorrhynchoides TaxID=125765 RepID=UPI003A9A55B2